MQKILLIVEDEPSILEILKEDAEAAGLQVLTAVNAQTALEQVRTNQVTAILSDISMPGGSGVELLAQIRASGKEIPLVFLSAYDTKEYMRKAIQLGAVDFLQKPFHKKDLQQVLFRALEIGYRQNLQQENPEKSEFQQKMINLLRASSAQEDGGKAA